MSAFASSVVAGITTTPSFMQASIVSHSSSWLPSISSRRSPRLTPWACSHAASWLERADSSAYVAWVCDPSSSTTHSAVRCPVSSVAAMTSNQSRAQLKCSGRGAT